MLILMGKPVGLMGSSKSAQSLHKLPMHIIFISKSSLSSAVICTSQRESPSGLMTLAQIHAQSGSLSLC